MDFFLNYCENITSDTLYHLWYFSQYCFGTTFLSFSGVFAQGGS